MTSPYTLDDNQPVQPPAASPPPEPNPNAPPPAAEPDPRLADLEARAQRAETAAREAQDAARYWADHARRNVAAPAAAEPEPPPTTQVDLVEAITSGDQKALRTALLQLGFVDAQTVEKTVQERTAKATREAVLIARHQDLANSNSQLFRDTSAELARLQNMDPIEIAVELATLRGRQASAPPPDPGPSRPVRAELAGAPSSRTSAPPDETEELNAEQKGLLAIFQDLGYPMTEDGIKARFRAGVNMAERPARRS